MVVNGKQRGRSQLSRHERAHHALVEGEGSNHYTYVRNNPANLVDPTGMVAAEVSGRLVGQAVGAPAAPASPINWDQSLSEYLWQNPGADYQSIAAPPAPMSNVPRAQGSQLGLRDVLYDFVSTADDRRSQFINLQSALNLPWTVKQGISNAAEFVVVNGGYALGMVGENTLQQSNLFQRFQAEAYAGKSNAQILAAPAINAYQALTSGDPNRIADVADSTAKLAFSAAFGELALGRYRLTADIPVARRLSDVVEAK